MEVYSILVWHAHWEYPSMLIKQRSINYILTQEKKIKQKRLIYFFLSHSAENWTLKMALQPSMFVFLCFPEQIYFVYE